MGFSIVGDAPKGYLRGSDIKLFERFRHGYVPIGKYIVEWSDKISKIIKYQWDNNIQEGLRGVLLFGPPGVGKTLLAFWIAFKLEIPESNVLYIDFGSLGESLVGEMEKTLRNMFNECKSSLSGNSLLIFDDAESIFFSRKYAKEAWQYTLVSVFLHELDMLDTSKSFVILTTNMPELLDPAIKDRLLPVLILPSMEDLLKIAERRVLEYRLGNDVRQKVLSLVRKKYEESFSLINGLITDPEKLLLDESGKTSRILREKFPSIRFIEKAIIYEFARKLLEEPK